MVIGNGMIATRFHDYITDERFVIFASGVSNSASIDPAEFQRERQLLENTLNANKSKHLVYISTCSIYDPALQHSAYVIHKLAMEQVIQNSGNNHTIFRASNPVGNTANTHTFLNYFIDHIVNRIHFDLWQYASRNLIDMDDMYKLINYFLQEEADSNRVINIANPFNYPVLDIAKAIEQHFNIQGNYTIVEKGSSPLIDTAVIQPLFSRLGIHFGDNYLGNLLVKYFPLV
jgi:UDP-2-acetamido-2,6-beta-L-arabino-hexul-4-ose reductase